MPTSEVGNVEFCTFARDNAIKLLDQNGKQKIIE